jgi:cytochrome b pre-mRNA-processing protein 3
MGGSKSLYEVAFDGALDAIRAAVSCHNGARSSASGRRAIPMIFHLFRRNSRNDSIASLYGTIVAQARAPAFYQIYRVPDTVAGRLEMIMLHVVLVLGRLEREAPPVRRLGQDVFDTFCRDMDASLREMGVGDLAVPRRMRGIGGAFYDRQAAYRAALAASDERPLAAALARNVFRDGSGADGARRLASYVRVAAGELAAQDADAFRRAQVVFPDPDPIVARAH